MHYLIEDPGGYQEAFQACDITSGAMKGAIREWFRLYFQQEATELEDPCQRIAYAVVGKLCRAVFSEYRAVCDDPFGAAVLEALADKATEAVQLALIGGEALLKPIPTADGFRFAVISRANMLVFGRDGQGNITDLGTVERSTHRRHYYTLLERRSVDDQGYLTIRNSLYQSYSPGTLGNPVPLGSLRRYASLPERFTFAEPVGSLGLVSVRTPMVNCVDGSCEPVSVYAPAVGLIHCINRNEAQLNGEFLRGQSRILVSQDLLKVQPDGSKALADHVFVGLDEDPDRVGVTIFSPKLREGSFLARKQEYLRNVENVIGLKRGVLSPVEAAARTATEITSSQGEYNLTIMAFQRMWERALRQTLKLCGCMGAMCGIPGARAVETVSVSWGNGVLYDEEKTGKAMLEQVSAGILQPERYLGWYYDRPCDTPDQRERIRREFMP